MKQLAEGHNKALTVTLLSSYVAVMEDLTEGEIILAFTRAHEEENYWPSPSRLRGLSGPLEANFHPYEGKPAAFTSRP